MFAFRKLRAAQYHCKQVDKLVDSQHEELRQRHEEFTREASWKKTDEGTSRVIRSRNEFSFELCAFFAAIRSAIDFLTQACAHHISGAQQATSISTFFKLIKSGKKGPILEVVAKNEKWLLWIREYRDYLAHRVIVRTMAGNQIHWKAGMTTATSHPIVVPSETPRNVPDTRRARVAEEPESFFTVATSESFAVDARGRRRLAEYTIEIEPTEGYIRIEELMKREVAAFESFFIEIVNALKELDFAPTPADQDTRRKRSETA